MPAAPEKQDLNAADRSPEPEVAGVGKAATPAKEKSDAKSAYKSTLNLPKTDFPMKAGLPVNEPLRLKEWAREDLYAQIRKARAGAEKYILHDGPPYANGGLHLGHALNKTLKDFVVKTKTMAGYDAPYVPGWDCHGLPIEIKVDEQLGRKKLEMNPLAVRKACREYAQKYLDLQREQFIRLGVFGRWERPYSTMDAEYEARIAETFFHFFENGFVYKGLKPVYWCIHDKTALAEAEVEYEMHTSPSIYVRYKLTSVIKPYAGFELFKKATVPGKDIYAIIWTTTPWTLPASLAIAFHPKMEYVAIDCVGGVYIVAHALLSSVITHCHLMSATHPDQPASQSDILAEFHGVNLDRTNFQHPFLDRQILGTNADYVTAEQGTGAVHTAPSHGADDFYTGSKYGLSQLCNVDEAGRLRNGLPEYEGLTIFKANAPIIELVRSRGALMGLGEIHHSYPHCWRCHNPVIFRATEQWFISMETPMLSPDGAPATFRQRALDEIKRVHWDPAWGQERISNMVATRPDWCISRQRIWGVPIAVFLCQKCHEPLRSPAVNKLVVELFMKESADVWYARGVEEILPPGTACPACGNTEFRKEMDILDVWFESGASSHAVMDFDPQVQQKPGDPDPRADLYAEGGDQHRGWFMSSLLCSIGMHNRAPFKSVATYGWTLDEKGRALSKSLGNFIDPVEVMNQLGGDIVRLWVASVDFREDVVASLPLMKRLAEEIYRKLRNTFRFMLGNLHDFDPATNSVPFEEMQPLDQYMLARTAELTKTILKAYEEFEFHRVYHSLNEFCNSDLSALYLDVLKDRLYTFAPNSKARRSAQTTIYKITDALARLVAPILSFTADEVWQSMPHAEGREPSVHLALFPMPEYLAPGDPAQLLSDFELLLALRKLTLKKLEVLRSTGEIGKALEAQVSIVLKVEERNLRRILKTFRGSLKELFNVSEVTGREELIKVDQEWYEHYIEDGLFMQDDDIFNQVLPVTITKASGMKCERCWNYTLDVGQDARWPEVCLRCAEALDEIGFPAVSSRPPS